MKTGTKRRKPMKLLAAGMVFCIVLGAAFLLGNGKERSLGTINGSPFYQEELDLYKEDFRAGVAASFSKEYGLGSIGKSFWETAYDGITPEAVLTSLAMEALIRDKVIQQEAVSRGITAPLDYLAVAKAYDSEKADNGQQMVYGPKERAIKEYRQYLMTRAVDDLKAALLESDLKPTEKQLEESFISLPQEIKERAFVASGYFVCLSDPQSEPEPFAVDSREIHREDTAALELAGRLFPAEAGDTVMMDIQGLQYEYFIETKDGGGYMTCEEAPGLGRNKWINDQFERYIDDLAESAEVLTALDWSVSR